MGSNKWGQSKNELIFTLTPLTPFFLGGSIFDADSGSIFDAYLQFVFLAAVRLQATILNRNMLLST